MRLHAKIYTIELPISIKHINGLTIAHAHQNTFQPRERRDQGLHNGRADAIICALLSGCVFTGPESGVLGPRRSQVHYIVAKIKIKIIKKTFACCFALRFSVRFGEEVAKRDR